MRALFTKKTSHKPRPPCQKNEPSSNSPTALVNITNYNGTTTVSNIDIGGNLGKILSLPMPNIIADGKYDMDIFTVASLNSESIQRFIGPVQLAVPSTSSTTSQSVEKEVEMAVNAVNFHNWTPLMYASYLGHKEMSHLLLQRNADSEARNASGQTSLMMAASCGSVDVINVLIRYSAKVNNHDKFGRSPLHYAVKYNQSKIASVLLEKGADPNFGDFEDMTPTLMACEVGNEATVMALIRNKGDPNRRNKKGENGASLAIDHPKVLTILKNYASQTAANENNDTPINLIKSQFSTQSNFDAIFNLLTELELEKYTKNFQDNGIQSFAEFVNLTDAKLDEMGITLFGPKKKILNAILHYRQFGTFDVNGESSPKPANLSNDAQESPKKKTETSYDQANLTECQEELRRFAQVCALQIQILRENQSLNAQTHSLLTQIITAQCLPSDNGLETNIKIVLKRIEQNNSKLLNLFNE